ncbi:MAG: 3-oxoacyl-ACP synthase [Sporocytophaga sp.]|uniref:3-oxoacyl-ACP synthase n=1 Tax=Sporocytophaga sp. TaxID=2231183 RepID=UPI001B0F331A|nr:3-oxoacyl-ACP synthase [Sporocytophaga sp.]MBO9702188.1 3-oxoacyl-ACP synthase [Sporocytophaga sp.]
MSVKVKLYELCTAFVEQRIASSQKAIEHAQLAANEETKSSAGDKYETGRAMMQLEIEKQSVQLGEAMKLKQVLSQINPEKSTDIIQSGSLITTDQGNFYISISAGKLEVEGSIYFAVSPVSPIGALLMGKKSGDSVQLNGKTFTIRKID